MNTIDWLKNDVLHSFSCSLKMIDLEPRTMNLRANGPNCYGWSILTSQFEFELFYYVKINKCVIEFFRGNSLVKFSKIQFAHSGYVELEELEDVLYKNLSIATEKCKGVN